MNPGMSTAVQQAIQRRSNEGALNQTSPDARMQQSVPQPTNPSDINQMQTPSVQPGQQMMMPGQPPAKFVPQTSGDMIVMALIDQLKSDRLNKQAINNGR
jgi:hypothetical protein